MKKILSVPRKTLATAGVAVVALISALLGNKTADKPPDVVEDVTPDPSPTVTETVKPPPIIVTRTIRKTIRIKVPVVIKVPVPGPTVTRTVVRYVSRAANRVPVYSSARQRMVAFGHWLQARGYHVSEQSQFGGVTPGAHSPGSAHYSDDAIDVNKDGPNEQADLAKIRGQAHAMGLRSITSPYPGHGDHDHIDTRPGPNLGGN